MNIQFLSNVSKNDIGLVGGKGASLGKLISRGFAVPEGFIITTTAYQKFRNKTISESFKKELLSAFDQLHTDTVAVRSSAVSEDAHNASWAGQFESYLNIHKQNLLDSIQKCWVSLHSRRVNTYAKNYNNTNKNVAMAVVVQKMVQSDVSGVLFTVNPLTKDTNEIVIEACRGLGEKLVQGEIIPDSYSINKKTLQTKSKYISNQHSNLSDKQLRELAILATKIEKYFQRPQDIEWALQKNEFAILQSRPITTL